LKTATHPSVRVAVRTVRTRVVIVTKANGQRVITSACILVVACPVCRSKLGEPCKSKTGYVGDTHYKRRELATARRRREAERKASKR